MQYSSNRQKWQQKDNQRCQSHNLIVEFLELVQGLVLPALGGRG
jgi:hypothetical protein